MKFTLNILFILFAMNTHAATLECHWQKNQSHSEAFFKPAQFTLNINQKQAAIYNDTFFRRTYVPCYNSAFRACAFSFNYDKNSPWEIMQVKQQNENSTRIKLINTWYFTSWLNLSFDKNIIELTSGETTSLVLSGDDDSGTYIQYEMFNCLKK